jgi:flagellar P-ring protein precursor FlgI
MKWTALILAAFSAATLAFSVSAETRIRDIVDVEGIRQNDLVGYGIVVGLNGTGDTVKNSPFTEDSLSYMLERLGVNVQGEEIKPKNVAAVLVTATLPSFSRSGSSVDVTVASIGDAKSLEGGTLILTPLKGADNEVYAVAQGAIIVSGIDVQAAGRARNARHTDDWRGPQRCPRGTGTRLRLQPARPPDPGPPQPRFHHGGKDRGCHQWTSRQPHRLHARPRHRRAQLRLAPGLPCPPPGRHREPDCAGQCARPHRDRRKSGTIVLGDDVTISRVAIAQGNISIKISETPVASQPEPLLSGETQVLPDRKFRLARPAAAILPCCSQT